MTALRKLFSAMVAGAAALATTSADATPRILHLPEAEQGPAATFNRNDGGLIFVGNSSSNSSSNSNSNSSSNSNSNSSSNSNSNSSSNSNSNSSSNSNSNSNSNSSWRTRARR